MAKFCAPTGSTFGDIREWIFEARCGKVWITRRRESDRDDVIAGPFLLIGDNGESLRSLTGAEVDRYMERFAQPEEISQKEVEENSGFTFMSM